MAFLRTFDGETVLVAVNTGDEAVSGVSLSLAPGAALPGTYAAPSLVGGDAVAITVTENSVEGLALDGLGVAVLQLRTAVGTEPGTETPSAFGLGAPYPNPSRGTVRLDYRVGAGAVAVDVFDLLGRRVLQVVDGPQVAGAHQAEISTAPLAPGVYLVRLRQGAQQATRRLVVAH